MTLSQAAAVKRFGKGAWRRMSSGRGSGSGFSSLKSDLARLKSLSGLRQLASSKALEQMRETLPPMDVKQLANLRACVMHRNTCVHYAILGFQPACLRGLEREERPAVSLANHLRMQANVLELLLWPQAFTESEDPEATLVAGDPAKPNANGETPLDLAAKQGSDDLLQKLLGWDHDAQVRQPPHALLPTSYFSLRYHQ